MTSCSTCSTCLSTRSTHLSTRITSLSIRYIRMSTRNTRLSTRKVFPSSVNFCNVENNVILLQTTEALISSKNNIREEKVRI